MSGAPDRVTVSIDQHLPLPEVARLLACSSRTIVRRIEADEFRPRPLNIAGRWLIPARAVKSFIERHRV